jgi:hypothetical protein
MDRVLKLSDVRRSSGRHNFEVIAAPTWAFNRDGGWVYPIPELWEPLLAELRRLADEDHARQLDDLRQLMGRVQAGTATGAERQMAGLMARSLTERPIIRAMVATRDQERSCRVCRSVFYSVTAARYCSDTCHTRRPIRRKSRAKVRPPRPCDRCAVVFQSSRADARFCSVRCRVAAHRAAGQGLPD